MKNKIITLLLFCLLSCTCLAQFNFTTGTNGTAQGNVIGTSSQVPYAGSKNFALTSDTNFTRVDTSQATTIQCPDATGTHYNGVHLDKTGVYVFSGLTPGQALFASSPTTTRVTLTAAQITTMDRIPVALITPASNQFIQVQAVTIIYNYGTTQYTNGVTLEAYYTGSSGSYIFTDDAINHATESTWLMNTTLSQQGLTTTVVGAPLLMKASTAQTGGNGTEAVYITYSLISIL